MDERIPVAAFAVFDQHGIADEQLVDRFGALLGVYRFNEQMAAQKLTPAERKQQALATAGVAAELRRRLATMDPVVDALLAEAWLREGELESMLDWRTKMGRRLVQLEMHLKFAASKVSSSAGRRPDANRDRLYRDTIEILATAVKKPAAVAAALLATCGIPLPADPRTLRRRSGRK